MADDSEMPNNSRFAYLMQPIRDLSKNWDIDITAELQRYIADMHGRADPTTERFNFPEAALLIQGTAHVYGRKVDYLYQLVLQTLERFRLRNGTGKKGKNDGENTDGATDENADPEALIDFDHIQPAKSVTVKDERRRGRNPVDLRQPLIPMPLVPFGDCEKGNVPLFARRNRAELIGKRDDFRTNICHMHGDGALLLDLLNADLIDKFTRSENYLQPTMNLDFLLQMRPTTTTTNQHPIDDNYDDDDRGGGDDDAPMEIERDGAVTQNDHRIDDDHRLVQPRGSTTLLDNDGQQRRITENTKLPPADPFALHDAFVNTVASRALRVGKPYRLADRIVNAKLKKGIIGSECSIIDYIDRCFYLRAYKTPGTLKRSLHHIDCPALDDYIGVEQKRRLVLNRQYRGKAINYRDDNRNQRNNTIHDDGGRIDDGGDLDEIDAGGNDVDMSDDDDGANGADALDDDDYLMLGARPPEMMTESSTRFSGPMNFEDQLKHLLDRYWSAASEHLTTSSLSKRVQNWEDRVLPILEEEHKRRAFDIHAYGDDLLSHFNAIDETYTLDQLTTHMPHWEKCRYFLASLMIANTYNVHIDNDDEHDVNRMRLTLLKRERHHEQFEQQ